MFSPSSLLNVKPLKLKKKGNCTKWYKYIWWTLLNSRRQKVTEKKYQGLFDCWNLDDTRVSADAMKHVTCTLKMVYIESVTYFKSANSLKIVFKIVP